MTIWPEGVVYRLTPGPDAPAGLPPVVDVTVYAPSAGHARNTLRVLAILAASRHV